MGATERREQREIVRRITDEAGISPARRRTERALVQTLKVLTVAGIALLVVGIVVGDARVWIGGSALFLVAVVLVGVMGRQRLRRIDKVRWQDGTVTFRTVEPGDVEEDGQRVTCDVEINPTPRVVYETDLNPTTRTARVYTTVGPLDTERLVVGATMRCIIDRIEFPFVLRAFPYAEPNATLPSGRELKFMKAQAKTKER